MENWSLYEDASLLAGCLLADFPPVTFEPTQVEDGLKVPGVTGQSCPTTYSPGSPLSGFPDFKTPGEDLPDPLGESWFDTKVDLLDIFDTDLNLPALEALTPASERDPLPREEAGAVSETTSPPEGTDGLDAASMLLDMLSRGMPVLPSMDNTPNMEGLAVLPPMDDTMDLSPVSPEDVDSVLSSSPTSPWNGSASVCEVPTSPWNGSVGSREPLMDDSGVYSANNSFVSAEDIDAKPVKAKRGSPYERHSAETKPVDRRQRKKQQNKDAATRYRVKKRIESDAINSEYEQLETRNYELTAKVGQMKSEIQYLKDLLAEVHQAKGMLKCTIVK